MLPCVEELEDNEENVFEAACDTLLRVSSNILKNPGELKFRSLKLTSTAIASKLMIAAGGMECLFAMGFKESPSDSEALILPMDDPLDQLKRIHAHIESLGHSKAKTGIGGDLAPSSTLSSHSSATSTPIASSAASAPPVAAPAMLRSELSFRRRLESGIRTVRAYEDPRLQAKALACVPLDTLKREAHALFQSAKLRDDSDLTSENTPTVDPEIGFEDCLMLLLIRWFKREFFKWVNQPPCEKCEGKTDGNGMGTPTDEETTWEAGRVELYRCSTCDYVTRFPRYNHPGKLLETRRGRCGEWANCFALISRACGFETRYVLDWTDHVWTEYFSKSQDRWVHGDTCEEGHDKPLLYEHGWGKKLSYIIAFSIDDIQDVTWRYTTKQAEVIDRRKEIRENVLVSTILQMRVGLLASVTVERKNELNRRTIRELAEFLGCDQRTVTKGELSGRQSGSLSWRLSRQETGVKPLQAEAEGAASTTAASNTDTQLIPTAKEIAAKRFNLKYFPIKDFYRRELGDLTESTSWVSLVHERENLEMKVEHDWRMTYLARRPDLADASGSVAWKLNLKGTGVQIKKVDLVISHQVFENGKIDWIVCCDGVCRKVFPKMGQAVLLPLDIDVMDYLELRAVLSGGSGANAWQHSQLFRSTLDDAEAIGLDWTVYFR